MPNILVVDDELSIRESFSLILEGKYNVLLAASGEAALKIVADEKVDMAYLDIRMPGLDGLATLKRIKQLKPDLEIVMVTAVNEVQKASEAVRNGAQNYVVKPFDVHHILKLTAQVLRKKAILKQGSSAQKKLAQPQPELIGQSEKIIEISKLISTIKNDQRVLILGEIGTEKTTLAQLIHSQSDRALSTFQQVDLAFSMSSAEIKNLLVGQDHGTLYINNLEALSNEVFLAIRENNCRLIASSTTALAEQNKAVFDFFSEIHLELPPLRTRTSDISLLINHFVEKFSNEYGRRINLSSAALAALTSYSWPGNTAQLRALIERLVLTCDSPEVTNEDLPINVLLESGQPAGKNLLNNFEQKYNAY